MFDVERAVASLSECASSVDAALFRDASWMNAPVSEYVRSPAAVRVARAAQASGLFLFHYETRQHLELPEHWVPEHQIALAEVPQWVDGVLPERKYQSFRHDQLIGGFHPGHRAKWSTHELCHGLVGFAWTPNASPFFLATAGRLSELLPVVLYYFLDECYLQRCPVHQHGGALFRTHCVDCERVAAPDLSDPRVRQRLQDAARYLDQEMAAIARSRRLGVPVPHLWGSLDLCSDGLAYARSHGLRLRSEAFHHFMSNFFRPEEGWFTELEALEARVEAVAKYITEGEPLRPWGEETSLCRDQWMRQDVAWRLFTIWEQCDQDSGQGLMQALSQFAEDTHAFPDALSDLERNYASLSEAFELPAWSDLMGVGYTLPNGQGHCSEQILEGIRSALPVTATALGDRLSAVVPDFVREDLPVRERVATRFERWMAPRCTGPMQSLLAYETMLVSTGPRDGVADALRTDQMGSLAGLRVASGVVIRRFEVQPASLLEDVSFGDRIYAEGALTDVDGGAVPAYSCGIVCFRTEQGHVETVEVAPEVATCLMEGTELSRMDEEVRMALVALGILVPDRWAL